MLIPCYQEQAADASLSTCCQSGLCGENRARGEKGLSGADNYWPGNKSVTLLRYNEETGVGVAASEGDIIRDQQERDSLLKSIASAEAALAASAPSTRRVLERMIEGVKGRVATLEAKINDEREAQLREQATVAIKVQREAALSAGEHAEYSGFLKEDFFTKRDFGSLEHFYAGSWDRLSEDGKEEMSHRVWEGIRHDEYRFTDLPKNVQEKEEDFIYSKFSNPAKTHDSMEQIPTLDRADFMRAYNAGDREGASKVLNRESFSRNVALKIASIENHRSQSVGNPANDDLLLANDKAVKSGTAPVKDAAEDRPGFADVQLNGLVLIDSTLAPSSASIPNASDSRINGRSPA